MDRRGPPTSPEIEKLIRDIDLAGIIRIEKKIAAQASKWLIGIDPAIDIYTKSLFILVKYSNKVSNDPDKIKGTAELGQPQVLIEGPPGFGKTDMMQSMALSIRAKSARIQCHFELMPRHIIGGSKIVEALDRSRRIVFEPGPLLNHFVLVDELNRARGQTMSAFIEATEERSITPQNEYIDEKDRIIRQLPLFPISGDYTDFKSPRFFMVTFTENPHGESQGTNPTPWAILDRITLAIRIERPSAEDEERISSENVVGLSIEPVTDLTEILACAHYIYRNIKPSPRANKYRAALLRNTTPQYVRGSSKLVRFVKEHIEAGASTRAHFALEAAARVEAAFEKSDVIKPEHFKAIAGRVVPHRLLLKPGKERKISKDEVFRRILELTEIPPWK